MSGNDSYQTFLRKDGELLVRGSVRAACLDADSLKPARLPPDLM